VSDNKKACTKCGSTENGFRTRKASRDGLTSWCRACLNAASNDCVKRRYHEDPDYRRRHNAASVERQRKPEVKEQRRLQMREYNSRPEIRVRNHRRSKEWAAANHERVAANGRRWLKENRERARAYWRKYSKTPHGRLRHRIQESKRRALMRGVECTFKPAQWDVIVKAWGRCAYCGATGCKLTIDHVIPISKGGVHAAHNVVPACKPCNDSKKDSILPKRQLARILRIAASIAP
jgi:5-methylcytosine-specific restriction endonuclease McrA